MPVTITVAQLCAAGACEPVLDDLRAKYGERRTFADPPALAEALLASGKVDWFVRHMLCTASLIEHVRAGAPILTARRQDAPTRTAYVRQRVAMRAEYERQRAAIVARLYFEQESSK
jgi:hypothetical protein